MGDGSQVPSQCHEDAGLREELRAASEIYDEDILSFSKKVWKWGPLSGIIL